jgi:hypothetical protein
LQDSLTSVNIFHTNPSHNTQEPKVIEETNHINTKSSIAPTAIRPVRKYKLPKRLAMKVDFSPFESHMA